MKTNSLIFIAIYLFQSQFQQYKAQIVLGAKISFLKDIHDYGTLPFGSEAICTFEFINNGNEPLIISRASATCGCTVPEWSSEPIAPNMKGKIYVKYDTKKVGTISKSVTITSNATNEPTKTLRIKGEVLPETINPLSPLQSDDIANQNSIYQVYTIEYDAEKKITLFNANFHENNVAGKSIILSNESKLIANSELITFKDSTYSISYSGYIDSVLIEYLNNDGESFVNIIYQANEVDNCPFEMISKSANNYWTIVGEPICDRETIDLSISNRNENQDFINFSSNLVGNRFLQLPLKDLQTLSIGKVNVELTRSKNDQLGNWNASGGMKISKYRSKQIIVNVTE